MNVTPISKYWRRYNVTCKILMKDYNISPTGRGAVASSVLQCYSLCPALQWPDCACAHRPATTRLRDSAARPGVLWCPGLSCSILRFNISSVRTVSVSVRDNTGPRLWCECGSCHDRAQAAAAGHGRGGLAAEEEAAHLRLQRPGRGRHLAPAPAAAGGCWPGWPGAG